MVLHVLCSPDGQRLSGTPVLGGERTLAKDQSGCVIAQWQQVIGQQLVDTVVGWHTWFGKVPEKRCRMIVPGFGGQRARFRGRERRFERVHDSGVAWAAGGGRVP